MLRLLLAPLPSPAHTKNVSHTRAYAGGHEWVDVFTRACALVCTHTENVCLNESNYL